MKENNRQREIDGLVEGALRIGVKQGVILTYNEEEEFFTEQGVNVRVLPAWKFFLSADFVTSSL